MDHFAGSIQFWESAPRPCGCYAGALTTELHSQLCIFFLTYKPARNSAKPCDIHVLEAWTQPYKANTYKMVASSKFTNQWMVGMH